MRNDVWASGRGFRALFTAWKLFFEGLGFGALGLRAFGRPYGGATVRTGSLIPSFPTKRRADQSLGFRVFAFLEAVLNGKHCVGMWPEIMFA